MKNSLKYIDLFAGCGGLSTGLHLAGWKGLFAVERNSSAFATLQHNLIKKKDHFDWPEWLSQSNWDIKDLLKQKSSSLSRLNGKVDLIVGGPPCQGFSTAGRRQENDERNDLVHSYLEFVKLVKPKVILFENVRGFTMKFTAKAEKGVNYSRLVTDELRKLGYGDARGEIIDMSQYGIPQRRQRFIVIATLMNSAGKIFETLDSKYEAYLAERGIPKRNKVGSALSDLRRCHGVVPCPDSSSFQSGVASHSSTGLQKYLKLESSRRIPDSHRFVNHTEKVEDVFVKLLARAPRNRCIMGEEREKYGLKKRSVTVLSGSATAPTVTTIPDDFVHYCEPRVLTVRECARLQTFPDWFEFKGKYTTGGKQRVLETPRYTQVGNAVPPLFAELMGFAVKEALGND